MILQLYDLEDPEEKTKQKLKERDYVKEMCLGKL